MRLWSFLVLPFLVALTYGAPVSEVAPSLPAEVPVANAEPIPDASAANPVVVQKDAENVPAAIPEVPVNEAAPVLAADEPEATTGASEAIAQDGVVEDAVATTISPVEEQQQAEESNRDARQMDDDDEEESEDDNDSDDDEDEEDEEEDEEDSPARDSTKSSPKPKSGNPGKKTVVQSGKPVPSLNEGGGEDDEAEDMGHFEGNGSPKSREAASDEAESEEEPEKEKNNDEEENDDEEEDSDEDEEADETSGPQGLVAESSSTENQGAEPENEDADAPPSPVVQNEVEQQPLAVAVVQNEVSDVPVVPVIVSENPEAPQPPVEQEEEPKKSSSKKTKDDNQDDDDEDEDSDEEDEEEEDNAARSEKVSQARAAYSDARDADVLYYYPYPDNSQMPEEPYF